MKRTELNLSERRTNEDLLHRKVSVTEFALCISRLRKQTALPEFKESRIEGETLDLAINIGNF